MPLQLPLVPTVPSYRVGTALGGRQYVLDVRWNVRDAAWFLDVLTENEEPIYVGIKVVLGALLGFRTTDERFPAGVLTAADLSGERRDATLDDLGTRVVVYFVDANEL